jgi:hypothetical protein
MIYGVLVNKGGTLLPDRPGEFGVWTSFNLWQPPLVAKSRLGPLRLLHFLALAHLVTLFLPKSESVWHSSLAKPFVICGRHSLPVYCAGTVLACLSVIAFKWVGVTQFSLLLIGFSAVLLQFAFATLLDRREANRRQTARPLGSTN